MYVKEKVGGKMDFEFYERLENSDERDLLFPNADDEEYEEELASYLD